MFNECYSLKSIDLSSFNTSTVVNMKKMFMGCSSLNSIKLSSFDTSEDMEKILDSRLDLTNENIIINKKDIKLKKVVDY